MNNFEINEKLLIKLLLSYLRRNKYYDSLLIFSLETNLNELNLYDELNYISSLCYSGRWEDLLKYLTPLKEINNFNRIEYEIRKQQYLEALTWQSVQNPFDGIVPWRPMRNEYSTSEQEDTKIDMELVIQSLKMLESLCTQKEFNQLCNCLTYATLADTPDFSDWTISKGRLECFEVIYTYLSPILQPNQSSNELLLDNNNNNNNNDHNNNNNNNNNGKINYPTKGIEDMIALGLQQFVEKYLDPNLNKNIQKTNNKLQVELHSSGLLIPNICSNISLQNQELPKLRVILNSQNENNQIVNQNNDIPSKNNEYYSTEKKKDNQQQDKSWDYNSRDHKESWNNNNNNNNNNKINQVDMKIDEILPPPKRKDQISESKENKSYKNESNEKHQQEFQQHQQEFKGKSSERNINQKGTSWNIELDNTLESPQKPHVRVGSELLSERSKFNGNKNNFQNIKSNSNENIPNIGYDDNDDNNNNIEALLSPYYSNGNPNSNLKNNYNNGSNYSHQNVENNMNEILPIPPSKQPIQVIDKHQIQSNNNNRNISYDDEDTIGGQSMGTKSTSSGNNTRKESQKVSKGLNNRSEVQTETIETVYFKWNQLSRGQCHEIIPTCIHRDSSPLRSISLSPEITLNNNNDRFEDSLSFTKNQANSSLLVIGSNAKSMLVLNYDHSEKTTSGRITIVDEIRNVHTGSVYSVDWSSDGRYIASGSNDKLVKITSGQIPTGPFRIQSSLKGHTGTVRVVKFSPHPAILASGGSGDCKLRVWDVNQGALLKDLTPHEDDIHAVDWIADTVVLSGCEKGLLMAHDLRTSSPIWNVDLTNQDEAGGICSFYCNQGTDLSIIGHSNGGISLFDIRTRRVLQTQIIHKNDIRSVCMWSEINQYSRNDIYALTTSFDGVGKVWQLRPSPGQQNPFELIQVANLIGHKNKILCCIHSKKTNDIFTSSADGTVLCWNPKSISQRK